jgi:hypothetical protein
VDKVGTMPWWAPSRPGSMGLRIALTVAFLVLSVWAGAFPARAAEGWEVPLAASAGRATLHLSFGQKKGATAGVDGRYEVPAMPGGILQGGFLLKERLYWRDIRGLRAARPAWRLRIAGGSGGKRIVLQWQRRFFPPGERASLVDPVAGLTMNMRTHGQYVFYSNGPRTLRIETEQSGANK